MGLDIAFNKQAALAAGLVLHKDVNGEPESIESALADPDADPDYVAWLQEEIDVLSVPDTNLLVRAYVDDDDISIRANKWGYVYAPMTQWLKAHNIEWAEL